MDLAALLKKRDFYQANKAKIPEEVRKKLDASFAISYAHNSTAIEGNTLSLIETKLLLEDQLSVGGKDLREIFEVINHNKAYEYVRKCVDAGKPLEEQSVKEIHALLLENIMVGGIYRNVGVRITGARHTPPAPGEAYQQIKYFYAELPERARVLDPLTFAAWTHAEFIKIHPFTDGNGRTARLIMNYQLLEAGFPPVSIAKEERLAYFEALEAYAVDGNLAPFTELVAKLADEQLDQYLSAIPAS